MASIRVSVERLQAARDRIVRVRSRVDASEPAPVDRPRDRDWVAREILAHVDEMIPYWIGEIERILTGGPEPVPFGRTESDPIRTMTVDRDRTLPITELYARLDSGIERAVRRLLELDDRQLARRGLHPRRGEMTVESIVETFLVGHLEEHCGQLTATIEGQAPS